MASRPDDPSANDGAQNLAGQAPAADTHSNASANRAHEISRFPRSMETAEVFLRRAARQLNLGDYQLTRQARTRSAALEKRVLLDFYRKCLYWDLPIEEEDLERMKEQIKNMNLKTLSQMEFKLPVTPARFTIRYLDWVFTSLGTTAPNPIHDWLRDLEADIRRRYPNHPPEDVFLGAERNIFSLTSLYLMALSGWTQDFSATVAYSTFCANASTHAQASPQLLARRIELDNRLLVGEAMVQIIEEDYLHAPVLPTEWRALLDRNQLHLPFRASGVRGGRASVNLLTPAECLAQARAKVTTLWTIAQSKSKSTIFDCHTLIFNLAEARIQLHAALDNLQDLHALRNK